MDFSIFTFQCGVAPFNDFIFFAGQEDAAAESGQPNSTFMFYDGSKNPKINKIAKQTAPWTCIGFATAKSGELVAIGSEGECWVISPKTSEVQESQIEAEFDLRALSAIAGSYYAAGMGRTVFLRDEAGNWKSISPKDKLIEGKVLGFEDIDGFSADDIYVVGWAGEIWNRTKESWSQINTDSKTNFNAVCCAEDKNVYVVGDNGVCFVKRNGNWQEIKTGITGNLQDVRDFGGKVYVVSDHQIFQLQGDQLIEEPAFSELENCTFHHLLKTKNGIVSLGSKDIWALTNGVWGQILGNS